MERSDGSSAVLGADGALLTPPLSSDTSLQELIDAELRTRRATELPSEQPEPEPELMVVAADLKPSQIVTKQPESIMVLGPNGRDVSDEESDSEVREVTEVIRDIETVEAEGKSKEVTTEVTKAADEISEVTEHFTEQVTEKLTENVSEYTTEQIAEEMSEEATQRMVEQTSEVSHQVTEEVTEEVTNHVTGEVSRHATEQLTEVTERTTQYTSDEAAEEFTVAGTNEGLSAADVAETASVHSSRSRQSSHSSSHSNHSSSHSSHSGPSSRRSSAAPDGEEAVASQEQHELPVQQEAELTGVGEQMNVHSPLDSADVIQECLVKVHDEEAGETQADLVASADVESGPLSADDGNNDGDGDGDGEGEDGEVRCSPSQSPAEPTPANVPADAEPEKSVTAANQDTPDDVIVTNSDVMTSTADDVTVPGSDDGIGGIESSKVTDEDSDEGVGGGPERRSDAKDAAKKLRRKKKTDSEKEAGRRRSSFGKDEPSEPTRIHVRSFDSSKAISRFSKEGAETSSSECRACGRRVFQMESVHAEGGVWHKNCFRCSQCNKPLTVDTYASHEGKLYCQVHHRQLLKAPAAPAPAAAATTAATAGDTTESGPRAGGGEMVDPEERESQAPAANEIVRASNKADYGLDDLQHLNVKDRFSVFERPSEEEPEKTPASVEVKRSQSILDKMKKFQGRTAARDADSPADSESSEDEGRISRDPDTIRSSTKKERPIGLAVGLGDVKSRFEGGGGGGDSEASQDPAKGEAAKLRGMICGAREHKLAYEEALREREAQAETPRRPAEDPGLVIQGNLRESYERAVQEADSTRPASREEAVVRGRAADMASRFERGQLETENGHHAAVNGVSPSEEVSGAADTSLSSEVGSGELARVDSPDSGLAAPEQPAAPAPAAEPELLHSDTTKRMLNKFKQLEQNAGHAPDEAAHADLSPHRERAQGNARQMLSKYRQMQEAAQKEDLPDGPRPLKSFTPPPEDPLPSEEPEDTVEDSEDNEDPDIVRASAKVPDEFLNKKTDQARNLRDKFESWAPPTERSFTVEEDCKPSLETTRNLRAKFESLKEQQKPAADKPQSHRTSKFIMEPTQTAETCSACGKRVYAMERLEVDKRILHKNCFRCSKCNCVLRMDTYTFNAGKLFCTPHFKQMFKTKGNYDEGFGVESRAKHWSGAPNHGEQPAALNGTGSASPRPAGELTETNGSASPLPDTNGSRSPEPEPEEPAAASDPEPEPERGADVFQQVYESTVADGL